jgi:hypothetical protein
MDGIYSTQAGSKEAISSLRNRLDVSRILGIIV